MPILHAEQPGAVPGRVLDHFERMEAGFLVQLQLARDAEAVHRIDVAGVVAGRDQSALVRELAHRVHPDAVLLPPRRLPACWSSRRSTDPWLSIEPLKYASIDGCR